MVGLVQTKFRCHQGCNDMTPSACKMTKWYQIIDYTFIPLVEETVKGLEAGASEKLARRFWKSGRNSIGSSWRWRQMLVMTTRWPKSGAKSWKTNDNSFRKRMAPNTDHSASALTQIWCLVLKNKWLRTTKDEGWRWWQRADPNMAPNPEEKNKAGYTAIQSRTVGQEQ